MKCKETRHSVVLCDTIFLYNLFECSGVMAFAHLQPLLPRDQGPLIGNNPVQLPYFTGEAGTQRGQLISPKPGIWLTAESKELSSRNIQDSVFLFCWGRGDPPASLPDFWDSVPVTGIKLRGLMYLASQRLTDPPK